MSQSDGQEMGNLRLDRGGLYGRRPSRVRTPRRPVPADPSFSRRVQHIAATWKANGGTGPYASRAIANTAHGLQHPLRHLDRQMRDAVEAEVPLERILEMGRAVIERARELWVKARRTLPAA